MSPTPPGANSANSTQVSSGKEVSLLRGLQMVVVVVVTSCKDNPHDFSHLLLLEGVLLVEQWVGEHLQQSLVLRENTTNTNKYNKYKQIQQKIEEEEHLQKSLVMLETNKYWDSILRDF